MPPVGVILPLVYNIFMNPINNSSPNGLTGRLKNFFLPSTENDFRAKIFAGNFLIYFLITLVAVKAGLAFFFGFFPKSDFFADITKSAIVDLANYDRRQAGVEPLFENALLDRAALMKAQDMLAKGYFEHISPQGLTPWYWFSRSGYDYRYAGENLAIGFVDSSEVNGAWLASPAHKANILNGSYRETGIAVLSGLFQGSPTTVVVQLFGTKMANLTGSPASAPFAKKSSKPITATAPDLPATPAALAALSGQAMSESVLGASDIEAAAQEVLRVPDSDQIPYRITAFLAGGYFTLSQRMIYGSLFFIIILLALNFVLKADFSHRDLLFKTAAFLVLAVMFLIIDRRMLLMLVPHLTIIS